MKEINRNKLNHTEISGETANKYGSVLVNVSCPLWEIIRESLGSTAEHKGLKAAQAWVVMPRDGIKRSKGGLPGDYAN
jgi:hypothetical protein